MRYCCKEIFVQCLCCHRKNHLFVELRHKQLCEFVANVCISPTVTNCDNHIMMVMMMVVMMVMMMVMMMMVMVLTCMWLQEELLQWKSQSVCPPRLVIVIVIIIVVLNEWLRRHYIQRSKLSPKIAFMNFFLLASVILWKPFFPPPFFPNLETSKSFLMFFSGGLF